MPIEELRQDLYHVVANNDVLAVSTSTGTGKSTQVPKMLLEAGYGAERFGYGGRILVTEPRRIAAAGCARRILEEVQQNN